MKPKIFYFCDSDNLAKREMQQPEVREEIIIRAPVLKVWRAITEPAQMEKWISDSPIHVSFEPHEQSPLKMRGVLHNLTYHNKGTIVRFEPTCFFSYLFWSSLSQVKDIAANYTEISYSLSPLSNGTHLILQQTNFPTESVFLHSRLYWRGALQVLKDYVETDDD